MKKKSVVFGVLLLGSTVLLYQNCSDMQFTKATDLELSSLSTAVPPICRNMTAAEIQPKLLYSWDYDNDVEPTFKQVMASPVVGDLDGDHVPEIGFVSYFSDKYSSEGVLRILNGATGKSEFSISSDALRPFATTTPLFVDIDGDGKAEISYLHYSQKKIVTLNSDGSLRWELPLDFSGLAETSMSDCRAGFSAADLDRDGKAEIIAGGWIISEGPGRKPILRGRLSEAGSGCYTYAASLSNQPKSELQIIGSKGVYTSDGKLLWSYIRPGVAATANLLPQVPGIEVVVTGGGYLTIYNGLTGAVIADKHLSEHSDLICLTDSNGNPVVGGGQATIGDFDGNPNTLEIAVATGKSLTIFNAMGEKIAGSVTQDCSSLSTGLTSFDFNGDGKPEIVYADEQYVRIYEMDGSNNLKVIWSEINPTGTLREYPVVADVRGDGYAELVVVSNNMWADGLYKTVAEQDRARSITGVRVFGPAQEKSWMPTRPVWNQHAYFSANVNDNLTVPSSTASAAYAANSFKRNTQKGLLQQTCVAQ